MPASLAQCLAGLGTFARLRQHVATMSGKIASLLGYACFAAGWQSQTRFCSLCGHPTVSKPSSLAQCCTNPSCAAEHFPRINPAMIVLVHHPEKDMCLLGRQSSWKPRVYSALAGYVEPGESAEDAVLREVMEETGIRVRDIRYHSSQPWPFSSSLMLGFHALAENLDIHLDDRELEDARWFPRQEIPGLLEKGIWPCPAQRPLHGISLMPGSKAISAIESPQAKSKTALRRLHHVVIIYFFASHQHGSLSWDND